MRARACVCVWVGVHAHVGVRVCVCEHVRVCVRVCVRIWVRVRLPVCVFWDPVTPKWGPGGMPPSATAPFEHKPGLSGARGARRPGGHTHEMEAGLLKGPRQYRRVCMRTHWKMDRVMRTRRRTMRTKRRMLPRAPKWHLLVRNGPINSMKTEMLMPVNRMRHWQTSLSGADVWCGPGGTHMRTHTHTHTYTRARARTLAHPHVHPLPHCRGQGARQCTEEA